MKRTALIMMTAIGFLPAAASAHLVNTGVGPFYDGIAHVLLSPEDLLVVIALALLSGLAGQMQSRRAVLLLPLAWLVGGLTGLHAGSASLPAVVTSVTFLALGGLVALEQRGPALLAPGAALLIGLLHGYANGSALFADGAGFTELLGILVAVFVTCTLLAASVVTVCATRARIAVRVLGSWIAAVGVLMLGWTLNAAVG